MAQLKELFTRLGFSQITTLLNSGNVVFFAQNQPTTKLEEIIATALEAEFSFPIPVFICRGETLGALNESEIFGSAETVKTTKQYVTFLASPPDGDSPIPPLTNTEGFTIVEVKGQLVFSVVDSSVSDTIAGMKALEQIYGKGITTRNWNTVQKIQKVLAG